MDSVFPGARAGILAVAGLLGFPLGTLSGQGTPYPDRSSFFSALAAELSIHGAHAVDAQSFAEPLLETLGWTVTTEDVEDLMDFRYEWRVVDRRVLGVQQ